MKKAFIKKSLSAAAILADIVSSLSNQSSSSVARVSECARARANEQETESRRELERKSEKERADARARERERERNRTDDRRQPATTL